MSCGGFPKPIPFKTQRPHARRPQDNNNNVNSSSDNNQQQGATQPKC